VVGSEEARSHAHLQGTQRVRRFGLHSQVCRVLRAALELTCRIRETASHGSMTTARWRLESHWDWTGLKVKGELFVNAGRFIAFRLLVRLRLPAVDSFTWGRSCCAGSLVPLLRKAESSPLTLFPAPNPRSFLIHKRINTPLSTLLPLVHSLTSIVRSIF
jgi:hypothetical protein